MEQYPLDLFTNPRKSSSYKKSFDESSDFKKGLTSKSRNTESWRKLQKYTYDEPESSEAYKNAINKIYNTDKLLQQIYAKRKLQSSLFETFYENHRKWKTNAINQEKEQDKSQSKIMNQQPLPIKIISPQGSRVLAGPDNSAIIFPPQIVNVRPLSAPKPQTHVIRSVPVFSQTFPPSNTIIIPGQPSSPRSVIHHEPIIRKNCENHNRIVSYPVPPGHVNVHQRIIPHEAQTYVQSHGVMPIPMLARQNSQPTFARPPPQIQTQNQMYQTYDKMTISLNNTIQSLSQGNQRPPGMTSEQYQRMMQQQYERYNQLRGNKQNIHNITNIQRTNNSQVGLKKQAPFVKKSAEEWKRIQTTIKSETFKTNIKAELDKIDGFEDKLELDQQLNALNDISNTKDQRDLIKKMDDLLQKYGQKPVRLPQVETKQGKQIIQQEEKAVKCQMAQSIVNKVNIPESNIFYIGESIKREKVAESNRIWPENFYEIPKIQEQKYDLAEDFMQQTKNFVSQIVQIFKN